MITEEMARKQLKGLHQEGSALVEEFEVEQRSRPKPQRRQKAKGTINVVIQPEPPGLNLDDPERPDPDGVGQHF
jgi:hypothetical protein